MSPAWYKVTLGWRPFSVFQLRKSERQAPQTLLFPRFSGLWHLCVFEMSENRVKMKFSLCGVVGSIFLQIFISFMHTYTDLSSTRNSVLKIHLKHRGATDSHFEYSDLKNKGVALFRRYRIVPSHRDNSNDTELRIHFFWNIFRVIFGFSFSQRNAFPTLITNPSSHHGGLRDFLNVCSTSTVV